MKKIILALCALGILAAMLSGCGAIVVEDAEPVQIGMLGMDRRLT